MTIRTLKGGAWQTPQRALVRKGGAWQDAKRGWAFKGGAWQAVWDWTFYVNITWDINDCDLRAQLVSWGWNEYNPVEVTIGTGARISAVTTTNALVVQGSFPNGITLINNGLIVGYGGNGGRGGDATSGATSPGAAGGNGATALAVGALSGAGLIVYNYGSLAGGGGGGGGGGGATMSPNYDDKSQPRSGGGGGGGRASLHKHSSGGSHGSAYGGYVPINGQWGGSGTFDFISPSGGGLGGAGGPYYVNGINQVQGGAGGNGGNWGANGAAGVIGHALNGTRNSISGGGGGGASGLAVWGNSRITWGATGNRFGGINAG